MGQSSGVYSLSLACAISNVSSSITLALTNSVPTGTDLCVVWLGVVLTGRCSYRQLCQRRCPDSEPTSTGGDNYVEYPGMVLDASGDDIDVSREGISTIHSGGRCGYRGPVMERGCSSTSEFNSVRWIEVRCRIQNNRRGVYCGCKNPLVSIIRTGLTLFLYGCRR